jgi:hypothetical protein
MKARHALLVALVTGAAALATAAAAIRSADGMAEGPVTGTWSAEPASKGATRGPLVQLSLHRGRGSHESSHSHPVALAELKGLTADQMNADGAAVTFVLERDAGRLAFEGTFRRGEGAGHFTFTPRSEFVAAMRGLGYADLDDEKLYSMAVLEVGRDFVRELDQLGYSRLDLDQLLSLRIHGADPAFIRDMKALGYAHLAVDDLVSLRIHGVTGEYIRRIQNRSGKDVSVDRLVSMRIHGEGSE